MSPVDALNQALAAEHASLFVYGALGAATSQSATPELFAAVSDGYRAHRGHRDQLTTRVRDHGGEPVPAAPGYELPARLAAPDAVAAAALEVERRCEATYRWLVAQTSGADRRFAVVALTNTAVRSLTFRGSPEIFPGAGEVADR